MWMKQFQCGKDDGNIYQASILYYFMDRNKIIDSGGEKNNHSGLIQRKFYQCYCAKNYQSYSALYLHVKNKHGKCLSFKSFGEERIEWSGSIKNIYLEFNEEFEEGIQQKPSEICSFNLRKRKKRLCMKQSDSQNQKLDSRQISHLNLKIQQKQQAKVGQSLTIQRIFHIYEKADKNPARKIFRSQLLAKLMAHINIHYKYFFQSKQEAWIQNFCQKCSTQDITNIFHHFYQIVYARTPECQRAVSQLISLSKFLYDNNFSTKIIVKTQEEQPNKNAIPCKVEENQKSVVKIEKNEHEVD